MENNNQPLTAHEILIKRYESKFEKYGDPVKAPHYWASQISDYREDILPAMEEYAAQAAAALKREVEELQRRYNLSLEVAAQLALDKHKLTQLLHEQFINPVNGYDESDWQSFCKEHGLD